MIDDAVTDQDLRVSPSNHFEKLRGNRRRPGSHRTKEFRTVQIAKAFHRLASGTHKVWEVEGYMAAIFGPNYTPSSARLGRS